MTIADCKRCERESLIYAKGLCSRCYYSREEKEKRKVRLAYMG